MDEIGENLLRRREKINIIGTITMFSSKTKTDQVRTTVLTLAICSVLMMLLLKEKYKLFGFLLLGVIVSTYLMFEICQGCIFPGRVFFFNLSSYRALQ